MTAIRETVVVEGKDDVSAVKKALDADVLATSGYGLGEEAIRKIRSAYERTGIVIFTDPDHAGRSIREKLTALFPGAKQAYLVAKDARKRDDVGIENAAPEAILAAVLVAGATVLGADRGTAERKPVNGEAVSAEDLDRLGLSGGPGSAEKREAVGASLGIGYANAKTFLARLVHRGISRAELERAVETCYNTHNGGKPLSDSERPF